MTQRLDHLNEFYRLMRQLEEKVGGKRLLKDCDGRMDWPKRGVYFFYEQGEYRTNHPEVMRLVRVGTHAVSRGSKSTLWGRLRAHRGAKNGGGNHRGSIFRLHVGNALIERSEGELVVPTWAQGQSAPRDIRDKEYVHEQRVSAHIGSMPFLCIEIDDESGPDSDRAMVEKNAIILLAGEDGASPLDAPSEDWLGHHSIEERIRNSGLWNLDYVGKSGKTYTYNPEFLDVLKSYIMQM